MTSLSATIAKLAAIRGVTAAPANAVGASRLRDLEGFGANPGALVARIHAPSQLCKRPALVVVLHGCTQTAGGYDHGSGWSRLADEQGFVCLFPEQQRTNNPNLCFNWFSPADNGRDRGEALSIRQMIDATVAAYDIDPSRVFVTGLSAGGAMTSVMLASYPELFAGGAIIAGLPHGSAHNVQQALQAMRDPGAINAKQLGDLVRKASRHEGSWPRISIWHGSADQTVSSKNADAILAQWLSVHDLDPTTAATEMIGQHRRRVWKDSSGRPLVEDFRIANMGHGTPIATTGPEACGSAMPHMLDAGISSTRRIASTWGLLGADQTAQAASTYERLDETPAHLPAAKISRLAPTESEASPPAGSARVGVEKVIHDALRAAGLMR
ncbi:MAG: PHB depolymerase family esterase [Pseudomonadota bacterium]